MSKYSKLIHILIGLPGSGKTTWSNQCLAKESNKTKAVHLDDWFEADKNDGKISSVAGVLRSASKYDSYERYSVIVLDGLFLNNKPIIEAVKYFENEFNDAYINTYCSFDKNNTVDITVKLHVWEPNIENCLHNDSGRRVIDSSITIKNAKIEYNLEELQQMFPNIKFEVENHKVIKATSWQKFVGKYGIDYYGKEKEYICSDSWSTGGTWANYMGHEGTISAEPEDDFEKLDEILQEEFPNISYLQYKELKKKYIKLKEWNEYDYYGGSEGKAQWQIKVRDLYDFLVEKGQIEE